MNQDEQKISFSLLEPIWMNSLMDDSPIYLENDPGFSKQFLNATNYVDYIGDIQSDPVYNTHPSFSARLEYLYGIVTGTKNTAFSKPIPLRDFYNLEKTFLTQNLFFDFKSLSSIGSMHADIADKAKKHVFYDCLLEDDIQTIQYDLNYMYGTTQLDITCCKKKLEQNPLLSVDTSLPEKTSFKIN